MGSDWVEILFNGANVFVLPFWLLMIVVPGWQWTGKVMRSPLPFAALALVYLAFFVGSVTPENAEGFADTSLSNLAALFSDEKVMATGWVHYLVMDLFVGRWIHQDAQENILWVRHSLVLCLFAGPLGLLSHITTAWITGLVRNKSLEATTAEG
ncbi:MAG: ABA4-like family protein [Cyanophyceae cyanobacterium]